MKEQITRTKTNTTGLKKKKTNKQKKFFETVGCSTNGRFDDHGLGFGLKQLEDLRDLMEQYALGPQTLRCLGCRLGWGLGWLVSTLKI